VGDGAMAAGGICSDRVTAAEDPPWGEPIAQARSTATARPSGPSTPPPLHPRGPAARPPRPPRPRLLQREPEEEESNLPPWDGEPTVATVPVDWRPWIWVEDIPGWNRLVEVEE